MEHGSPSRVAGCIRAILQEPTILSQWGLATLVFLACWWSVSFAQDRMVGGEKTWVPCWHWLGCDFEHNYYSSRLWLEGGDPYQGFPRRIEGQQDQYVYPPLVLACFAWCGLLPPRAALLVWLLAQAGITVLATVAAWQGRRSLSQWQMPLVFALAAMLGSYPILFEMERGNCNLLVLMFMLAALWAMQTPSLGHDLLAGGCLALATWIKIFPAILLLAVLFDRRWRVAATFAVVALVIGLADLPGDLAFAHNLRAQSNITPENMGVFFPASHTLSGHWRLVVGEIRGLRKVPGSVAWFVFVFPAILWVSYRVSRSPQREALRYPYWLWLIAAGTFLPVGANDYNLFFLPLAALIVWDRRDPVLVHVMMAFMLIWWQPLNLQTSASFLFFSKMIGLYAVAWSVVNRSQESAQQAWIVPFQPSRDVASPTLAA